ncbi:acyl carrier protein [Olsenella intestinalis]|uniref:acyl carrier protein n=1 Tax=Olsenella intestinalis TaxID=2930083 RepID=UPI00200DFF25|nr:phosphopantetheine-binding protein [Olsenella intestinalis]
MFESVKGILEKYTESEVREDSSLMGDLGLTSFDLAVIVSEFEEKFSISVEDRDVVGLVTVKDVVEYLEKKVG